MFKNNYEITVNAPVEKVWHALTNSEEITKCMESIKVISDWREGSDIEYTCYAKDGSVEEWNGMKMIWKGYIEVLNENKEFTCVYPVETCAGLTKESYFLEKIDQNTTKIVMHQYATSQEVADGYKDGSTEMMDTIKTYLEK